MKTYQFQHDIVGKSAFMKRIIKATNGCDKLSSNNKLFSYTYLSGV